jgi:hypothetical protein
MPSVQSSDALSVFGFFLTLVGLLGTFFYIHLAEWYRDVLALETKWEVNKSGDDQDKKAARKECQYEAAQMASWSTLVTSIVVTVFIMLVAALSIHLWCTAPEKSDVWIYIGVAGFGFLAAYLSMTTSLLLFGYRKARKVYSLVTYPVEGKRKQR